MALQSKNKFVFVDGSLPKPDENDPTHHAWERCNTLVVSWLHLSLSPDIRNNVISNGVAHIIWEELKRRFYQVDVFYIAELEEDLFSLRQGDLELTPYFTKLRGIWEELKIFRPIPSGVCSTNCPCVSTTCGYRDDTFVVCFHRGLNEQYSTVRSSIMLIQPLPLIDSTFSFLMQHERQILGTDLVDSKQLAGTKTEMAAVAGAEVMEDEDTANNVLFVTGKDAAHDDKHDDFVELYLKDGGSSSTFFTQDQKQALLALLQQNVSITSHTVSQVSHAIEVQSPFKGNSMKCTLNSSHYTGSWVIDTGATVHVTHHITVFHTYKAIRPDYRTMKRIGVPELNAGLYALQANSLDTAQHHSIPSTTSAPHSIFTATHTALTHFTNTT
ncbi:uncharacterized protein LOC110271470 [Arachis ipaensis]|uniref:uncharacterized protein LOC110271470 n=1 Tax=Arachis ipaensis TaxID=130454 RepID=UPI000A2B425C|nr:uncharacterized protein LOC110271470 [Arachis ipaensis]